MTYRFNENGSYSHMFTPNWLGPQTSHVNILSVPKTNVTNAQHPSNVTTTWLQNVSGTQVNAMNLHRTPVILHENVNSLDSTTGTNSQDGSSSSWLDHTTGSVIQVSAGLTGNLTPSSQVDNCEIVEGEAISVTPKPPKSRKTGGTGLPRRKPGTYTDEEARFRCEQCPYKTIRGTDLKKHVIRVHIKEKNINCTWPTCNFQTLSKSDLKRHINGVHLRLKKFACPLEGCSFRTDRNETLKVHIKCTSVHQPGRPQRKAKGEGRKRNKGDKNNDGTPKIGRPRGSRKHLRKIKQEESDDDEIDAKPVRRIYKRGRRRGSRRGRGRPRKNVALPVIKQEKDDDDDDDDGADDVYGADSIPDQATDDDDDDKKIKKSYKALNILSDHSIASDLDSDYEKPRKKKKPWYTKKPKTEWKRKHRPKGFDQPAFPPGVGFYCGNCEYRTLKEGELKKHVWRIHFKPKNHSCLIPGCDFKTSEGNLLKRHIDGVHLKLKAWKCSWEACNFATDRNATLKAHEVAMHLTPRPFTCTFCSKTFSSKYRQEHHINAHIRENGKKKMSYRCKTCVLDFENRSAYRRHLLKAHSKRLAYKCRLCRYSSNVKSHLARHISDRHLRIKPFACAFCPYSCAQAGNLRSHLKRVHPEEREALEALARPEREKPFPCNHCDYRATQSGNLRTHMKNKHPAEYLAREESRIRRQAERREERALNRLLLPKKKYPKKEYPRRGRRMRGRRGRPKRKEVESSEDEDKSSEDEDKEKIEPEDDMGDEIPENGDEGLEEGDLMEGVVGDMLPEDVCHEDGDILPEEENLTGLETMPMMMEPDVDFMVDAEDIPEEREIKYVPVSVPEQAPVIQHELKYVPDQHQITLQAVQQPDQVVQQQVVIQQRELKYSAATPEQLQQVQQVTIQQQNQLQQHHELKYITTQHTSQQQPEQKFVPQQVTQQVTQVVTQHDTIPTTTQTPPIAHEAPGLVPIRGVAGYQFPASFSHHMPYL